MNGEHDLRDARHGARKMPRVVIQPNLVRHERQGDVGVVAERFELAQRGLDGPT